MIKAVFLDIDGTIISIKHHTIPQSALDAISEARRRGMKIFLCTSRANQFLSNIKGIEYDGLVCLTGAHCLDNRGNNINGSAMNPQDVLHGLMKTREDDGALIGIAADSIYFVKPHDPAVSFFFGVGGLTIDDITGGWKYFPELPENATEDELTEMISNLGIMQLTSFVKPGEPEKEFLKNLPHSHSERWTDAFVDIVANSTSKAAGMEVMCTHFGFEMSETAAVGDGNNDIPMIKAAAVGIAMGNAADSVKAVADFVTADVDSDGLSLAFKHIFNA